MRTATMALVVFLGFGTISCNTTEEKVATTPAAMTCATCPQTMTTAKTTKVWNGKTYGFCCGDCEAAFTKNPEKYTK